MNIDPLKRSVPMLLAAAVLLPSAGAAGEGGDREALIRDARALTQEFAMGLQGELKAALEAGGPVHAIPVCREAAPGVGGRLSTRSGWAVGRTSLKVRNPRNAPGLRERAILLQFEARFAAGEPPQEVEHAAVIEAGGERFFHYMKAIPTAQVCTACHGTDVEPAVREAIQDSYPADAATGFEVGGLRGAFTFVRPLPAD